MGHFERGRWVNSVFEKYTINSFKKIEPPRKYRSIVIQCGFSEYVIQESPYIYDKSGIMIQSNPNHTLIVVPLPGFKTGVYIDYFEEMKSFYETSIKQVMLHQKELLNMPIKQIQNPWEIPADPINAIKEAMRSLNSSEIQDNW
jgi:hypothetical protein